MVNGKEFIKSLFVVPTLSTRRKGKKNERELVIKVVQPNRAEVEEIYLTERLVARVEENIEYSNNEYLNSFFGKEYFWLSIHGFGSPEQENIFGRPKKYSSATCNLYLTSAKSSCDDCGRLESWRKVRNCIR